MASTNLIAHVIAGFVLVYLVWLSWQEKRKSILLRSLYRPDRDWVLALSGQFLVDSLLAAGIEHDYEVLSREPRKIPLKALGLWIQLMPKGAKLLLNATQIEINLPTDSLSPALRDKIIEDLKKISEPLEAAFGLKFCYLMENKNV